VVTAVNSVIVIDSDDDDAIDEQSVLGNQNEKSLVNHQVVMNKAAALAAHSSTAAARLRPWISIQQTPVIWTRRSQDVLDAGPTSTITTDETTFQDRKKIKRKS
jgi:hypothetical protein